ncbi:MAG: hypothetical protein SYR96_31810 [Actinomycetota bacterium]|nr:hypothetical protein [Actinomycetota bacterium]
MDEPTVAQPMIVPRQQVARPPSASQQAPHRDPQTAARDGGPEQSIGTPPWDGGPQQNTGAPPWDGGPQQNTGAPPWDGGPQQNIVVPPWEGEPQQAQWQGAPRHPGAGTPSSGQVFAPAYQSGPAPYRESRKGLGVFAAIAAAMAAVFAVAALVFVLANRSGDSPDSPDVPTLAGSPPGDVTLVDKGTSIEVKWSDPTGGTVSFMVIMGHPGLELKPAGTLVPGRTSFEMGGLNATLNYCFAVVAVYSGNKFATSPQACTARVSATPR